MDMKAMLITLVIVIVGVILAAMVSKKMGLSAWEESYDEE